MNESVNSTGYHWAPGYPPREEKPVAPESEDERRARLALEKARMAYGSERKKVPGWKRPSDGTGRIFRRR